MMIKKEIEEFRRAGGLHTLIEDRPDDLFLVCASYEQRTTAVSECLAESYKAKRGIIYFNREFLNIRSRDHVQRNIDRLSKTLTNICQETACIEGSWLDPKDQFVAFRDGLKWEDSFISEEPLAVTLDITTFNREALLSIIGLIRTYYRSAKIRTVYVSPRDHGEWLSRGFRCVRSVMGFPGIQQFTRSTVVIGLSGFEPERFLKIIEEYEPAKVLLGIGDPPTSSSFLQRNKEEQKLVLSRQDLEDFRFPADNIGDCLDCLENILEPYLSRYNLILAPMSTKPSTVSALLAAERHPEIQIVYCVPGEYNIDNYSEGANRIFIDEIPNG